VVIFEDLSQRFTNRWFGIARVGNLELHKIAETGSLRCSAIAIGKVYCDAR
jgi:hypothetical protein